MFGDVKNDVEIARRAAIYPRLAFTVDAKPRTGLDTSRYLDLERLFFFYAPGTTAFLAWCFNDLAFAAAIGTGSLDAKKSLLKANLAAPPTGDTRFRMGTFLGPLSAAFIARLKPRDPEFFFLAAGGIFQGDLKIISKIGTPLDR